MDVKSWTLGNSRALGLGYHLLALYTHIEKKWRRMGWKKEKRKGSLWKKRKDEVKKNWGT